MLVGEAPGANEDKQGIPFIGQAGQVLNRALNEAGLTREQVYITNTSKCRPPQNRTPTLAEADACVPYLLEEIESVRPKVIVALGGAALKALTGKDKITKERGKIHAARKGLHIDTQITATLHPASTLYHDRDTNFAAIVGDLRFARSLAEGAPSPEHDMRLGLLGMNDMHMATEVWELGEARVLACDLEWTAGKDRMIWPWTREGEVYSLSLTGRMGDGRLRSVPIAWPPGPLTRESVAELLRTRAIIFHNSMADGLWLQHESFKFILGADTLILAHLIDETQPLNLEAVATRYSVDVRPGWKGGIVSERPQTNEEWTKLLTYNAGDTRATLLAFEGQVEAIRALPQVRKEAIVRLHRHLLLPVIRVLMKSAYVGVPINVTALREQTELARARQMKAMDDLADVASITPRQAAKLAASSDQTKQFVKGFGLDLESSNKDTLRDIVTQYPAVLTILRYRKEAKRLSTYFEPWTRMLDRQGDGRLHTIYRPVGARTGRTSAEVEEGGSLQVSPRNDPQVSFRQMIAAPPGRKILSADSATIEMRVIAWLAKDPVLFSVFKNDPLTSEGGGKRSDIHTTTAAFILAQREGKVSLASFLPARAQWEALVTPDHRQAAKGANFGLAFGQQTEGFREYARRNYGVEMSSEEAAFVRSSYFELYSVLPTWHNSQRLFARTHGYTETPFGRRRRFDAGEENAAINTPVQSSANDVNMLAMARVQPRYERENVDAVVVGYVHDSILVDVSDEDSERARDILVYEMEHVDTSVFGFRIPLPLPADWKVAQTWA